VSERCLPLFDHDLDQSLRNRPLVAGACARARRGTLQLSILVFEPDRRFLRPQMLEGPVENQLQQLVETQRLAECAVDVVQQLEARRIATQRFFGFFGGGGHLRLLRQQLTQWTQGRESSRRRHIGIEVILRRQLDRDRRIRQAHFVADVQECLALDQ
jgi:hypothetical protein